MANPKPLGTPIASLPSGSRYILGNLTLERHSWYEREILDETRTIHRYQFRDPVSGRLIVYSGCYLLTGMEIGDVFSIVGTIKRQEPNFNTTRIMRPIVKKVVDNPLGF